MPVTCVPIAFASALSNCAAVADDAAGRGCIAAGSTSARSCEMRAWTAASPSVIHDLHVPCADGARA